MCSHHRPDGSEIPAASATSPKTDVSIVNTAVYNNTRETKPNPYAAVRTMSAGRTFALARVWGRHANTRVNAPCAKVVHQSHAGPQPIVRAKPLLVQTAASAAPPRARDTPFVPCLKYQALLCHMSRATLSTQRTRSVVASNSSGRVSHAASRDGRTGDSIATSRQNFGGTERRRHVSKALHRERGGCGDSTNHLSETSSGRSTSRHSNFNPHSLHVPLVGHSFVHAAVAPERS